MIALGAGLALVLPPCVVALVGEHTRRGRRFFDRMDERLFGGDA